MYVTKSEIARAKRFDLLTYLRTADPGELKRDTQRQFCLRSHDSLKISNGKWHWFSRSIGGRTAVDYLIKVRGYTFPKAVQEVNRAMKGKDPSVFLSQNDRGPLRMPRKNDDNEIVRRYLAGRGIDEKLVDDLIAQGFIFENRSHHSAVFLGLDEDGKPAHAAYRATDGSHAKGDHAGSDKRFAFRIEAPEAETVHVFESAIDLLSYVTLCVIDSIDWQEESFISVAGLSCSSGKIPQALQGYLERNAQTKVILLHFDADTAGEKTSEMIKILLQDQYEVSVYPPEKGKDYNELLQMRREETRENG